MRKAIHTSILPAQRLAGCLASAVQQQQQRNAPLHRQEDACEAIPGRNRAKGRTKRLFILGYFIFPGLVFAQGPLSTSSGNAGVDLLYQFSNNLTNLTTQNGGALTQVGMTELSFISLIVLVSMVVKWSTSTMTLSFHSQPVRAGDLTQFLIRLVVCCLLENYWVNPLPGVSFGLNHLFSYFAQVIVAALDQNSLDTLNNLFKTAGDNTPHPAVYAIPEWLCYLLVQLLLGVASAILFLINVSSFIFYGVCALFGPIFIPFYMASATRHKFFHFVDVLLGFAMIGERAEKIRGGQVDSCVDNMLRVTHHGRIAALDMRLIDATLPDDPASKVNTAVENIFQIWDGTRDTRKTQVVFLDLSIPHHTPAPAADTEDDHTPAITTEDDGPEAPLTCSIYEEIRSKLVQRGVPAGEIRFIHEARTDADKIALFGQMNRGEVRILLGSTEKMGTGANIQKRLLALHHLDCPWRPSDLEQRNGRIHRQGNENPEIMIFGYISQGSFDGYMWQGVGNKAKFIAQAMSGDLSIREIEDADAMVLTAAEATALSSDDPLIRERINVEIDVRRLLGLQAAHTDQQHYDRSKLLNLRSSLIYRQRKLAFERGLLEEKQSWIAANPDLAPIDLPGVPEPKAIDIIRATRNQPEGGCVAHYGPFAITVSKPGRYSRLTTDFGESPEFDAHYPDITSSGSVLGTLTRHWNSVGSTISLDETQIGGMIRTIESLEATLASKAFPHQEQLDTKRARLKELDDHFKTIAAAEGGLGEDPDLDTEEAA